MTSEGGVNWAALRRELIATAERAPGFWLVLWMHGEPTETVGLIEGGRIPELDGLKLEVFARPGKPKESKEIEPDGWEVYVRILFKG